jgi:photosystem II stability/assembly factor-like uncharacterized protein
MMRILLVLLCLIITQPARSQSFKVEPLKTGVDASLRALSVVTDEIIWASGTKGTVIKSTDGGKTWLGDTVQGMEQSDFRTLYAFDARHAIIANVGSPGKILKTEDGGISWRVVYTNTHPDVFIDGVDFWNDREGILYGDPVDGRMFILTTNDGGNSWRPLESAPRLEPGEASFAASGTGIRCLGEATLLVCTGGSVSRLWHSTNKGVSWSPFRPPVVQGKSSTGIFSVAANGRWVVVGGDFQDESGKTDHHLYSDDEGKTWQVPAVSVRGYRECIEALGQETWIAVGPTGIDLSTDNGIIWSGFSDLKGLHVVRKSRKGTGVFAAGSQGAILRLK